MVLYEVICFSLNLCIAHDNEEGHRIESADILQGDNGQALFVEYLC